MAESANSAPCGRIYPRLLDPTETAEVADEAEYAECDETVEKVRSGDGQDEIAGVGRMSGEGDPGLARTGKGSVSVDSSIVFAQ